MPEYYRVRYSDDQYSDGITDPAIQWDQYRLPPRVDNLKVYDYGTWDGGLAIEAARRGAAEVWGLDAFVWEMWSDTRSNFERNVAMSGVTVRDAYVETEPVPKRRWNSTSRFNTHKLSIEQFAAKQGPADLVIAAGVFYHLKSPLLFLENLTLLLTPKSRLYLTTFCLPPETYPKPDMRFAYGWRGDDTNYWLASVSCVVEMAISVGLRAIETHQLDGGTPDCPEPRFLFVAQLGDDTACST
jgi:2-polyprenyl-3-methyl-5-hydroxy-6-metoxy-1,4-benzoquinol methylase